MPLKKVVRATLERGGAGVDIKCALGRAELAHLDPFLRLAHFGSDSVDGYAGGFPDHPHRGFETITYMVYGRMQHADNKGNSGLLDPGGAQRMTAGRGIVHSEMPQQESGRVWGFQLWLNLPAKEKMCAPRYRDVASREIPVVRSAQGASVRVVCGSFGPAAGPLSGGATEPVFLDISLPAGSEASVPVRAGDNAFAYVFEGQVLLGDREVRVDHLAVLQDGSEIRARAGAGAGRILFLSARPLGEPVVHYGPFVMNTADEIRQAITDFQLGRF